MTSQIRCNGCRHWFDGRHAACPDCARPRPRFNRWLRTAGLNSHLYAQAESAEKERAYADAVGV